MKKNSVINEDEANLLKKRMKISKNLQINILIFVLVI